MSKYIDKALHDCFHPKKGKSNLIKIDINIEIGKQHIEKAHNNLRAMSIMFDNNFFDWTIICGYYAMYHALLASLFNIGIKATTHYCAITAFKKFYIDRGKVKSEYINYIKNAKQLEKKYSEVLDKAQENRIIEQYGVNILSNDDAEQIVEDSEDFILKIEEILAE